MFMIYRSKFEEMFEAREQSEFVALNVRPQS